MMTLAGYVTVAPVMGCHVPEQEHLAPVYVTPARVTVEGLAHPAETQTAWCTPCGRPVVVPPAPTGWDVHDFDPGYSCMSDQCQANGGKCLLPRDHATHTPKEATDV